MLVTHPTTAHTDREEDFIVLSTDRDDHIILDFVGGPRNEFATHFSGTLLPEVPAED